MKQAFRKKQYFWRKLRKTHLWEDMTLLNTNIALRKNFNYRFKLIFIDKKNEKIDSLWSCHAFIGRGWGLSPKMTLWLYKRVIIHKIKYVAVAWWDIMDIALAWFKLKRQQRAAYTMITWAMRTAPTKLLEMLLDLPTLGTGVGSVTQMVAYSLPRPDSRNLEIGHNRIRVKIDKMGRNFSMIKDHITLWRPFSKYQIVITTWEEWGKTGPIN